MSKPSNIVAFKAAKGGTPAPESGKVTPDRRSNDALRPRDYLTQDEVERIEGAAKQGRNGLRDALMVRMAFTHGLRVSELVNLQWADVDFKQARLHVRRLKGSHDATHPIPGPELRRLRALCREQEKAGNLGAFMFTSERGGPITAAGFRKQLATWGRKAKIGFPVNPHALRHACGYFLANRPTDARVIQDYMGHANIANTVRYTRLASGAFKGLFN